MLTLEITLCMDSKFTRMQTMALKARTQLLLTSPAMQTLASTLIPIMLMIRQWILPLSTTR
jgi:hypothetical protein